MNKRASTSRLGFTMLELILAIAIASLLLTTTVGVYAYLDAADKGLALRFKGMNTLAGTQDVMRRAMQSLVAAKERPVVLGQDDISRSGTDGTTTSRAKPNTRLRLHLGMLDPNDVYDTKNPKPRRLELTLTSPPMATLNWTGAPIRGAFDLYPRINQGETPGALLGQRVWALVWQPLDPPGEPTLLIDNLELAEFTALDGGGLHALYESYYLEEFPWAIRVILWTVGGARADWMLEPGVRSGEVLDDPTDDSDHQADSDADSEVVP